jgi:hypothetical protein
VPGSCSASTAPPTRSTRSRRGHEMQAAAELLDSLGVPARVARASRDWLKDLEN